MAGEVENKVVPQTPEQKPENGEVNNSVITQISDTEQRALDEGWRPKDEWKGDPDEWKDARTYLRDGELFKKIEEVKRENKTLKKAVTTIKTHYEKVREVEYARAVEELKAQKKKALVDGDPDAVIEIDEKLAEARQELAVAKAAPKEVEQPEQHPDFVNWVSQNRWYETDSELRAFADSTGFAHAKANPGKSPAEVLRYVAERVTKAYPDKFHNQRRNRPNPVEGGGAPPRKVGGGGDKFANLVLSDDETRVMNKLVRMNLLTEEKYKEDLLTLEKQGKR